MPTQPVPRLGDIVYYYDEDKVAHAGFVANVKHDKIDKTGLPLINIGYFHRSNSYFLRAQNLSSAYHNGERWVIIERWSWPDAVPEDEHK